MDLLLSVLPTLVFAALLAFVSMLAIDAWRSRRGDDGEAPRLNTRGDEDYPESQRGTH